MALDSQVVVLLPAVGVASPAILRQGQERALAQRIDAAEAQRRRLNLIVHTQTAARRVLRPA